MASYQDQNGKPIVLGKKLGQGGEASVYLISGEPNSVLKVYIPEKRSYYEPRLVEMIAHPPEDQTRKLNPPHISITWAEKMVFENKKFIGFTMPIIKKAPDIFNVYSPLLRHKDYPKFNWGLLHHTALNLAIAVNAYHAAGYVIGDLNAKNVKVHENAMVTMIDTDSVQVRTASGKILRCPVGVPEFTSPELQGIALDTVDRDIYHDAFALGVMIFLLLMEGYHPFSGAPSNPAISVNKPAFQYCMENGIFPFKPNNRFVPPKTAPKYNILHPDIQALFNRCFGDISLKARVNRPLPVEWFTTLEKVENELKPCNHHHVYYPGYGKCPWCEREKIISSIAVPVQKPAPVFVPTPVPQRQVRVPAPSVPTSNPATPLVRQTVPASPPQVKKKSSIVLIVGAVLAVVFLAVLLLGKLNLFGSGSSLGANGSIFSGIVANAQSTPISSTPKSQANGNNTGANPDYGPCLNTPKISIGIGDTVKVIAGSSLRGHSSAELSSENIVAKYQYGDRLTVTDGPVCAQASNGTNYWLWYVEDTNNAFSWIAEGDQSQYFVTKE